MLRAVYLDHIGAEYSGQSTWTTQEQCIPGSQREPRRNRVFRAIYPYHTGA